MSMPSLLNYANDPMLYAHYPPNASLSRLSIIVIQCSNPIFLHTLLRRCCGWNIAPSPSPILDYSISPNVTSLQNHTVYRMLELFFFP
jgi:hypothetical protein